MNGYHFGFTCIVAAVILWAAGQAKADPIQPYCFDPRLCGDPGKVTYCPDTGGMMGPYGACRSLVTGPYAPGGLRPNDGR